MLIIYGPRERDKQSEQYLHGIEMKIMSIHGKHLSTELVIHCIIKAEII